MEFAANAVLGDDDVAFSRQIRSIAAGTACRISLRTSTASGPYCASS